MNGLLEIALIVASIPLIVWLTRRTVRNARRLERRIEEYKKERESKGPGNPYAELADLWMSNREDEGKQGQ
jgi:hypothetical protein